MPFTQAVMPQFRDADEDGLIGIRGCMRCFQDIHTWYMHSMDKGNDVLPEQYGAAWIYTRYQIRLHRKMDYSGPMTLSTWIEPGRQQARVTLNVTIRQGGDLTAEGRLESCIYSLTQRRPLRLSAVELDRMELRYQKTVRVSDLDKSRHMTNLRYIEMFQDAYDSAFWNRFQPREMEICFLSQCMEGEILNVKSRQEENALYLAAQHEDGTVAAVAVFTGDQS